MLNIYYAPFEVRNRCFLQIVPYYYDSFEKSAKCDILGAGGCNKCQRITTSIRLICVCVYKYIYELVAQLLEW